MKSAGLLAGFLFLLGQLPAQTPSIVTSLGYSNPKPVPVAPGQVITLFVHTQTILTQPVVADGSSWPVSLSGFSVSLAQTFSRNPVPVPIFSVMPVQSCAAIVPATVCTGSTAITVQIPFELVPNGTGPRVPANFALLTISDGNALGEPIALNAVSDQIHILNSCDIPLNPQSGPCRPVFLHADGTLVSSASPATAGESITLKAYGLGYADSQVVTGVPSPSPAPNVPGLAIDFRFGTDAAVTPPGPNAVTLPAQLVPGSIGLYQLTFSAPALPAGTPACSAVTNNLTVVIGRSSSFDAASLCLAVAEPRP
jgi:uncharacterized protein (TIGR03437 family)